MGKTSITLCAIKKLLDAGEISKVLLIAPLRVCHSVWPPEIALWKPFRDIKAVVMHGKNKRAALNAEADIYIINPAGLKWLLGFNKEDGTIDLEEWALFNFDMLVVDELSMFKDTGSKRFKMMKPILKTFGWRWGLTGSPAANGLEGLFGQCYMLDEGKTFGRFITHFRRKYFTSDFMGRKWTPSASSTAALYKKIAPLCLRQDNSLVDMPKEIKNTMIVELPAAARQVYTEVERDLISLLNTGKVTAVNAAALSSKCRQLAAGAVYLDEDILELERLPTKNRSWEEVHSEKVSALGELISEQQGAPLLVAYDFHHDLDRLKNSFGGLSGVSYEGSFPYIAGGVSIGRGNDLADAWNRNLLPVLFAQPRSIAFGLNLQGSAGSIVWFTPIYDYELYTQFNFRVCRPGNHAEHTIIHHIIAKDTVDEVVMASLQNKGVVQNSFFSALKNFASYRNEQVISNAG
jgi:SNF2 family DNA or RNA helicase